MPDLFGNPLPGENAAGGQSQGGGILSYIPGAQAALSAAAPVLDFLSRPNYASAGFFDALINDNASVMDALSLAGRELISPTKRRSFSDVISRANPDFAANNPYATKALGFLGDVALDPTTYLGLGFGAATKGARIGGKALTTIGDAYQVAARGALAGEDIITGIRAGSREAAETIGREQLSRFGRNVAEGARIETYDAGRNLFNQTGQRAVDVARESQSSIGRQIRTALGGKLPGDVTEDMIDDLAGKISLERLGLKSFDEAENTALTVLRRSVDKGENELLGDELVSRVAGLSPQAAGQIFKPGGLRLLVGVPLTSAQAEIPLTAPLRNLLGLERVDRLMKTVKSLPGIKQGLAGGNVIRGAFDRFYDFDPRTIEAIRGLENQKNFVEREVVRDAQALAMDVTAEGRERVSRVISGYESGLSALDEGARVERAPEVFQMALRTAGKLEPKEQALVMSLLQGNAQTSDLARALEIKAQSIVNYDPRVYSAISGNADEAVDWIRRANDGSVDVAGLDAAGVQRAAELQEAITGGANVAQDAVLNYAARTIDARNAVSKKQFNGALEAIYGTSDPAKLPKRVANDLKYFGEYRLPTADDEGNALLRAVDSIQSKYKFALTGLNPSFAPRQAVSNLVQSGLALQNNALRAVDPRSMAAAAQIVMSQRGKLPRTGLPAVMEDWIQRFTTPEELEAARGMVSRNLADAERQNDFAFGMEFRSPTGEKMTRDQIEREALQYGVLKGFGGVGGERLKKSLQAEIGLGEKSGYSAKALGGIRRLMDAYVSQASKVEDTSRLSLFLNARMIGDSPVQAAQRVNRALFDYQNSFSKFETQFLKRVVPFYSFNRLALPFVLKNAIESPASGATANKVMELIGDLVSGDDNGQPVNLTKAQREIFGDSFLVEQPRLFRGLDKDGAAVFNTFSNVTPFDVLTLLTPTKKNGEIDLKRTAEKTILGMLTPFLKIPAELAANREFFSDKVIADARGYAGAGRTKLVPDSLLSQALPEPVKAMIGWEWSTDAKTGKQRAFVNPYLAYIVSQAAPPFAKQFFKPLGDDETPIDRAIKLVGGVGEQSLDFKEAAGIQDYEDRKQVSELRQQIIAARRLGKKNSLEQAQEDYRKVIAAITEKRQRLGALAPTGAVQ